MVFPLIFIQNFEKKCKIEQIKSDKQMTFTFWQENTELVWNELISFLYTHMKEQLMCWETIPTVHICGFVHIYERPSVLKINDVDEVCCLA